MLIVNPPTPQKNRHNAFKNKTVRIEIKGTEFGGTFMVLSGDKNVRKNSARINKMAYVHQPI